MSDPFAWIDEAAAARRSAGLHRSVVARESALVNFGSNDYLGLAGDPRVVDAVREAAARAGWGAGASPAVSGWRLEHEGLARALAEFERAEAALLFPTGFAANQGAIAALAGPGDVVYSDRWNHACLVAGVRLGGAKLRVFPHNDAERLAAIVARDRGRFRRGLIAVDGVFSMDGDLAPLGAIADLAEREGLMLLVDEAHGTGVHGPTGRGAAEALGVADRVPVRVGTLSKALGSIGGFVAGSRRLIDHLVNHAPTFLYSTSLPPAAAAAAAKALEISMAEPWRRERVFRLAERLRKTLKECGFAVGEAPGPIVPVILGDPESALALSARLRGLGFATPAIRPPTVPAGTSRLRITVTAAHEEDHVDGLARAIISSRSGP